MFTSCKPLPEAHTSASRRVSSSCARGKALRAANLRRRTHPPTGDAIGIVVSSLRFAAPRCVRSFRAAKRRKSSSWPLMMTSRVRPMVSGRSATWRIRAGRIGHRCSGVRLRRTRIELGSTPRSPTAAICLREWSSGTRRAQQAAAPRHKFVSRWCRRAREQIGEGLIWWRTLDGSTHSVL